MQGFQYFLLYKFFTSYRWYFLLKFEHYHEYHNIQHSLKSGGTKYHVKQIKVPGTAPYWKACLCYHRFCFRVYAISFHLAAILFNLTTTVPCTFVNITMGHWIRLCQNSMWNCNVQSKFLSATNTTFIKLLNFVSADMDWTVFKWCSV